MTKEDSAEEIRWEDANKFIERQTKEIEREFKTSRPKPRNRAMGFRGDDWPRRIYSEQP